MLHKEDFKKVLREVISYEFKNITNDSSIHVFSSGFEKRLNRLIRSVSKSANNCGKNPKHM